jgi:AraC family transcriptional regulator
VDHSEFLKAAGFPAVVSSKAQGWRNVVLEQQKQPPQEFDVPPLTQHLVIFLLGPSIPLVQERDGHVQQGNLMPGEMLVTPAGHQSHWISGAPVDALHLRLEPEFVARIAEDAGMTPAQAEIVNNFGTFDPRLEQIGHLLFEEAQTRGLGGRLYADSLSTALAVHLLRRYSAHGEAIPPPAGGLAEPVLRRILEYINDNLEHDLSLQEIARVAEITPASLVRRFKQSMHLAPHQYVIKRRVERAKQMLLSEKLSIGEVAAQVGFYDQSHLTHHFKNLLGITPRRLLTERGVSQERPNGNQNVLDEGPAGST